MFRFYEKSIYRLESHQDLYRSIIQKMVVINRCVPNVLNTYAISALTDAMSRTVQHGFYDGTDARYGNPQVVTNIHNRSEFFGLSHYELRLRLDAEGMLDEFLVADERTPELDAVWFIETTETCKAWSDPSQFRPETQPKRYPGEDFVLWHGHLKTADVPLSWASWDVACGSLPETLSNRYFPYDSRNPQNHVLDMGIDWHDLAKAVHWWGFVHATATSEEVEWSTDPNDRGHMYPTPPVVVRLTTEAATEAGLTRQWGGKQSISPPGEDVQVIANYDWQSPKWPQGYPDDPSSIRRLSNERRLNSSAECLPRQLLGQSHCTNLGLMPTESHFVSNSTNTSSVEEA